MLVLSKLIDLVSFYVCPARLTTVFKRFYVFNE